jgi:hypothetical protein
MHRHGRVVTLRGLPVARWHRGVQCCPRTNFGSSVERTAKRHPLWQGFRWQGDQERWSGPVKELRRWASKAAGQTTGLVLVAAVS